MISEILKNKTLISQNQGEERKIENLLRRKISINKTHPAKIMQFQ